MNVPISSNAPRLSRPACPEVTGAGLSRFYPPAVSKNKNRVAGAIAAMLYLYSVQTAFAYGDNMTCSEAAAVIANAPGTESIAIQSKIANEWLALDQATLRAGHPAIEPMLLNGNGFFNQVSAQCGLNPGGTLSAAAGQVYRSAREQIDGY